MLAGLVGFAVAQMLSTRPDLLPPEFVDEQGRLTDHVPPAAWDQGAQVLTAEVGWPAGQVLAEVDRRPLAAASIARAGVERDLDNVAHPGGPDPPACSTRSCSPS